MNEILQEFTSIWTDKEGIMAIAEGNSDGEKCIVVYITSSASQLELEIPIEYKGIRVLIRKSSGIDTQYE